MPKLYEPLQSLGFLTLGTFDPENPYLGHRQTLDLIVQAEKYGFNTVQVRDRHLQYGISSPLSILAAASQLTQHISLGTAVIPLGFENLFRLAEDYQQIIHDVAHYLGLALGWKPDGKIYYPDRLA